jgi:hypothetical protein
MGIWASIKNKAEILLTSVEEYARLESVVKRDSASTTAGIES